MKEMLQPNTWRRIIIALLFCLLAVNDGNISAKENMKIDAGLEAFFAAVAADDEIRVQRSLDSGVPVDSRDDRGRTALLIAAYHNAINAAKILISASADVNAKDDLEDSPYLYAGAEGRLEILKMTVEAGADLRSVNRYGGTALIPAAHHGHVETVRYLLTTNTDVDYINELGWTALLEAVILGDGGVAHQKIVQLLLEAGADVTIADRDGVTPLQHAKATKQDDIVNLLTSERSGSTEVRR
jgi:uncharacterized protein